MFKRAVQANHWMAIGLEKWNELENTEIPLEQIRKWRKLEKGKDIESNDEEEEILEGSDNDEVETEELEALSETSDISETVEPESESEEGEPNSKIMIQHCDICPGRMFLTEKDMEAHMQSIKHLKRVQAAKGSPETDSPAESKPKEKKSKTTDTKQKQAPSATNRKARRAHLANSNRS